jgi:hypothetical protein
VNQGEIDRIFRSGVTAMVNAESIEEAVELTGDLPLDTASLIDLAGMGIAMTSNMVKIIADLWDVSPGEAWEAIVQIGIENHFPGMSIE